VGKAIRFTVEAPDAASATRQVDELCSRLLANPVIEDTTVSFGEPVPA
jgi:phosphoribosylformylglycinamidine synthase PurS subunit